MVLKRLKSWLYGPGEDEDEDPPSPSSSSGHRQTKRARVHFDQDPPSFPSGPTPFQSPVPAASPFAAPPPSDPLSSAPRGVRFASPAAQGPQVPATSRPPPTPYRIYPSSHYRSTPLRPPYRSTPSRPLGRDGSGESNDEGALAATPGKAHRPYATGTPYFGASPAASSSTPGLHKPHSSGIPNNGASSSTPSFTPGANMPFSLGTPHNNAPAGSPFSMGTPARKTPFTSPHMRRVRLPSHSGQPGATPASNRRRYRQTPYLSRKGKPDFQSNLAKRISAQFNAASPAVPTGTSGGGTAKKIVPVLVTGRTNVDVAEHEQKRARDEVSRTVQQGEVAATTTTALSPPPRVVLPVVRHEPNTPQRHHVHLHVTVDREQTNTSEAIYGKCTDANVEIDGVVKIVDEVDKSVDYLIGLDSLFEDDSAWDHGTEMEIRRRRMLKKSINKVEIDKKPPSNLPFQFIPSTGRKSLDSNVENPVLSTATITTPSAGNGTTVSAQPASGWGANMFGKPNTWKCEMCMVRNPNSAMKCLSCEAERPGNSEGGENTETSLGSSSNATEKQDPAPPLPGPFQFGSSASVDPAIPAAKGFVFVPSSVKKENETEKSACVTGMFNFGSTTPKDDSSKPTSNPVFQFGAGPPVEKKESNDNGENITATGFSFGLSSSQVPLETNVKPSNLTFGGGNPKEASEQNFSFGGSSELTSSSVLPTPSKKKRSMSSSEDSSRVSANKQTKDVNGAKLTFTFGVASSEGSLHVSSNEQPTGLFGAKPPITFGSKTSNVDDTNDKTPARVPFSFGTSASPQKISDGKVEVPGPVSAPSHGFSFGSSAPSSGDVPAVPGGPSFSFGSSSSNVVPGTNEKPVSNTGFSFAGNSVSAVSDTPSKKPFSFAGAPSSNADANGTTVASLPGQFSFSSSSKPGFVAATAGEANPAISAPSFGSTSGSTFTFNSNSALAPANNVQPAVGAENTSAFSFGAQAISNPLPASGPSFNFGSQTPAPVPPVTPGTFAFGSATAGALPQQLAPSGTSVGGSFGFGSSSSSLQPQTYALAPAPAPAPGAFAFGAVPSAVSQPVASTPAAFAFGSQPSPAAPVGSFAAPSLPPPQMPQTGFGFSQPAPPANAGGGFNIGLTPSKQPLKGRRVVKSEKATKTLSPILYDYVIRPRVLSYTAMSYYF
eukprot:CAMPEP_0194318684 /NCGR_PEP_ID=MMETSP0171-20130528/15250_1 /TAXON_ID=218684 /ORGANISM="Corethron pennatum, Strain L29A3" /LENGTH=1169 /DNA_ID=CAMNT_0039075663 /DNA_START=146 /DNA_END=3654 /DNA_ORIENTATION=-